MSEHEPQKRIGEILSALLAKRLELSLAEVEAALSAWRRGEHDVTAAHAATLKHAARTSAFGARIARAGIEGPAQLLRDAYDLKLVGADEFRTLTGASVEDVAPAPPLDEEAAHGPPGAMPKKREVVNKLLQDGPVLVHLDARRSGVDVPDQFRNDPKLVLRFGFGLSPPIPDLEVDDHGVRATLTFRGRPFHCRVPWGAVYAVVAEDGRGLVWPEHVPPEVQKEYVRSGVAEGEPGDGDGEPGDDDAVASDVESNADRPDPRPEKPKGRGHLRLV